MWKDTALVVTTDHGFLLGEHDFWAKNRMTLYEEIAHIPLFVHDPARPTAARAAGADADDRPRADVPRPLRRRAAAGDAKATRCCRCSDDGGPRGASIFGYFGGAVNVTDGRYTYHRFPTDLLSQEIYQYTLMPTHLKSLFTPEELRRRA